MRLEGRGLVEREGPLEEQLVERLAELLGELELADLEVVQLPQAGQVPHAEGPILREAEVETLFLSENS